MGRVMRPSLGVDDVRGRKASMGVGGRGNVGRSGGCDGADDGAPRTPAASPEGVVRARLYSRQHVGQRHSTTSVPSCAL